MYRDKFEKGSISVEVEIDEEDGNNIIKTTTIVKDKELLPTFSIEDKKIMDRVFDSIVNQQFMILNTREFWLKPPKKEMGKGGLLITCQRSGCGHQFEVDEPCGGCNTFKTTCPKCGDVREWTKGKKTK